jgi:hypothetical protein
MSGQLQTPVTSLRYSLNTACVGSRFRFDAQETEESPFSGIEPRVLRCPDRSLEATWDALFLFVVHKFCILSEENSVSVR